MHRRTTTLTASLVGTAVLGATFLAAPTALAAGETCRGEAATIVGTTPTLHGTAGRDVIVTGSSTDVFAGAGDDLVCVTGKGTNVNLVDVDAGPGDDVVDSTAMERYYYLTAILGDGSDTFVGGRESESVVAGPAPGPDAAPISESERDVIDTGAGQDSVISGGPGLPNEDEVRTGEGRDSVTWSGTMGPRGVLDAGPGHDRLEPRASGRTFSVDLGAQTMTRDGVREASFGSVEELWVEPEPGLGSLEVLGSDGDDVVEVTGPATLQVDLGAGADHLDIDGAREGSRLDLGAGEDTLVVTSWEGSVGLDLTRGTLAVDGVPAGQVSGVEDAYVTADEARVIGDDAPNNLLATGCRVVVNGRGGQDGIQHSNYDTDLEEGYDCDAARVVLRGGSGHDRIDGSVRADLVYGGRGRDRIDTGSARTGTNKAWGGPGNDRLVGGGARDVLVGGPGKDVIDGGGGRDKAVGGPGRDRCRAEVRRACER